MGSLQVSFPNLEILKLSGLFKLTRIWDSQLPLSSFCNLHILEVEKCPFLLNVVPSYLIASLQNLKKLNVEKCDRLQEVFYLEGLDNADYEHARMLSKLEELKLIDLPKLRYIWNKDLQQISCFQNLKLLHVKQCGSLTHLFSSGMALDLERLKDLCVEHCSMIKEIMVEDRVADKIIFPQTTQLSLLSLPNLTSFYRGTRTHEKVHMKDCDILACVLFHEKVLFPNLEILKLSELSKLTEIWDRQLPLSSFCKLHILEVKKCPFLFNVVPNNLIARLKNLEKLNVEKCDQLKEVFDLEGLDHADYENARMLSKLEELKLIDLPKLGHICNKDLQQISFFQNLRVLQLKQCDSLMYLFSASMALGLVQLNNLWVEHCSQIKEIIKAEDGVASKIIFPQTTQLSLLSLPKLTSFYLRTQAPGMLFNEEVAFPKLEILYVSGLDNVKKIWHNQLLADSLVLDDLQPRLHTCNRVLGKYLCWQNLKVLKVHNCGSLKNIFSPCMALGLVPLEGMKEITKLEGAEAVIDKIEFPELTSLSLQSLPSLASFYPGSHTLRRVGPGDHDILITVLFNEKVAFPSLVSLHISGLDNIKEIWNNKRTANSFSRLEEVKVEDCNELQKGLPLFALKWLSSLQFLRIANCGKLKEVFDLKRADILDDANCGKLKEVFDLEGADILDDVTETQLNKLELHDLPQLQYIWNRDPYGILTFENLDLVEVLRCQVLKGQYPICLTRDLSQLEKQLIRSRWKKDLEGKDEGEDFVFPEVTYDKLLDLRKIKGKEVVVVSESDYVGEISEDMPGSSG
ncbi:hypothetical protein AAG906_013042 [Vitis piasezkii]